MAHNINNNTLNIETILYAMSCIENDERDLAFEVVEESKLKPEHKDFIRKAIEDLGVSPPRGMALARLKNRLLSLYYPATYEFSNNSNFVARVLSFLQHSHVSLLTRVPGFVHAALALSAQVDAAEVQQSLMRRELADTDSLQVFEIRKYLTLLRHPETKAPLQLHEFFALAHNFSYLALTEEEEQELDFAAFAEALKKCPQTKFKTVWDPNREQQNLEAILTLPFFTDLQLESTYHNFDALHLLEGSKLQRLQISFSMVRPVDRHFESFSRMPHLETLDLRGSKPLTDEHALKLAKILTLKDLKLGWTYITPEGIRALLTAAPQIKVVQIPFCLEEEGAAIEKLLQDFPQVDFQDTSNKSFRKS